MVGRPRAFEIVELSGYLDVALVVFLHQSPVFDISGHTSKPEMFSCVRQLPLYSMIFRTVIKFMRWIGEFAPAVSQNVE